MEKIKARVDASGLRLTVAEGYIPDNHIVHGTPSVMNRLNDLLHAFATWAALVSSHNLNLDDHESIGLGGPLDEDHL